MLFNSGETLGFEIKKDGFACIRLCDTSRLKRVNKNNSTTPISLIDEEMNCMQSSEVASSGPLEGQAFPSIEVRLKEVRTEGLKVGVKPYEDFCRNGTFSCSEMGSAIEFETFEMPYIDNTELVDVTRFALVLEQYTPDRARVNAVFSRNNS